MNKLYKVVYGDFMSQKTVVEFLSKKDAENFVKQYGYDNWNSCTIIEHNNYDYKNHLKKLRKEKLESIWKNQKTGK